MIISIVTIYLIGVIVVACIAGPITAYRKEDRVNIALTCLASWFFLIYACIIVAYDDYVMKRRKTNTEQEVKEWGDKTEVVQSLTEWCPYCNQEVLTLSTSPYLCPRCELDISPCCMCDIETVECEKCIYKDVKK